MSKVIDGVLKEWADRLYYADLKGKRSKNIAGGYVKKPAPNAVSLTPRGRLEATVKRVPEVMVKITGGGKDMKKLAAHVDYIARNGGVELEDERGDVYIGKEDLSLAKDNWENGGYRIPLKNGTKREAFNIILSMPPDTDRESVKCAARDFASETFPNHQYLFAAHNDEKHPHVHLTVKAVDYDGVRLNPRKADLQRWRETFAEKLHEHGVEANATPRHVRGVTKKAEKQSVHNINKGYKAGTRSEPAKVTKSAITQAAQELTKGKLHENPARGAIEERRSMVMRDYNRIIKALERGEEKDRKLANQVKSFASSLPDIESRHAATVDALSRNVGAKDRGQSKNKEGEERER